jgi:hypothetical protein
MKKHEVLRVRLIAKQPGLESDRIIIERLSKQLDRWELWYEATTKQMRKINTENKELRGKVAALEDKMKRLLLEWNPPTARRLFQRSAGAKTKARQA